MRILHGQASSMICSLISWAIVRSPTACAYCARMEHTSRAAGGPDRSSWNLLAGLLTNAVRSRFVNQKMPGLLAKINCEDLATLADLVRGGKVVPVVDRTYSLGETAAAVRHVESTHARGKVVIAIAH